MNVLFLSNDLPFLSSRPIIHFLSSNYWRSIPEVDDAGSVSNVGQEPLALQVSLDVDRWTEHFFSSLVLLFSIY